MPDAATSSSSFWDGSFKILGLVGPLFATSLAITYDVGFFFGADIGFFTFFSLSEHLVFALQSVPFVAPTAFGFVGLAAATLYALKERQERDAKLLEKMKISDQETRTDLAAQYFAKMKSYDKWRPALVVLSIVFLLMNLLTRNYAYAFAQLLLTAWLASAMAPEDILAKVGIPAAVASGVLFILVTTFLIGIERANSILSSTAATENITVDQITIPAKIIRSGDRGLLFLAMDTKKLRFLRWDNIKQVDAL